MPHSKWLCICNIKDADYKAVARYDCSCLWLMIGCFHSENLIVLSRSLAMLVNILSQFQYHDIPMWMYDNSCCCGIIHYLVDNCTCKFSFKREMVEEYLVGVCGLTGVLS